MKSYFFVIGCNSVELLADGIQISHESGIVSIAWPDVKVATLAVEDPTQGLVFLRMAGADQFGWPPLQPDWANAYREMARQARKSPEALWYQGPEGPLKYDVLLIAHRGGLIQIFIEPGGRERDQLLTGLRTRLGPLWLGEDITSRLQPLASDPKQESGKRVEEKKSGSLPRTLGYLAVLAGGLFCGPLFAFVRDIPRAAIRSLGGTLSAGGWKPALLLGAALAISSFLYWVRKYSAE
jgi:hypothetical protein